jgi:D-sedoheptulose 7-phosphate isomerase
MADNWHDRAVETFRQTAELHCQSVETAGLASVIEAAVAINSTFSRGGKLLLAGNGGSAADAQHVAAEFVGRFQLERRALAAIALTTDTSVLTSLANDYAYDRVFARQVEAIGHPGDVLLAISTSGRSANILRGIEQAKTQSIQTIALVGSERHGIGAAADICVTVPSFVTASIQEVHRTILHVLRDLVESSFAHQA